MAQRLNESFIAIALAYGNTIPAVLAYRTSQNLLQALYPKAPPLLQLPYFTLDVVRAVEGDLLRTHLTVQDYMRTPESHRRAKVVKPGLLTSSQFSAAMEVAAQMPYLQVEKAFFKVIGERVITPSSLVNFVIKARFVPPGSRDVPAASESDLQDVDPVDRDLNALHERKRVFRTANAKQAEQKGSGDSGIQAPLAHAPYFARDHAPRWLVFLTDSKQGKISVPPFTFTTFDKPIFDDRGKPTLNIQTLKMQFQAPPQVGRYTFVMHLVCDSYVGMDTKTDVTLVIDDMSKADDIDADEDISEPDEGESLRRRFTSLQK